jgi:MFS transporter, DHA1 family, inner membrane transport protein
MAKLSITSPEEGRARERATLLALLFGNLVIGTGVLLPAGIINELARDLGVTIPRVATLIGLGAIVLCIGAPVLAFLTNKIDRRVLLVSCLVVFALGHAASALAPNFEALLTVRLMMIAAAAVFTPQAASAIGVFVAPKRRAAGVAFIFLGWSLANAVCLPLSSLIASHFGWRASYDVVALLCCMSALSIWFTLGGRVYVAPMSVASWLTVFRSRQILAVLLVTCLSLAGQFTLFPYLAPEFKRIASDDPTLIALALAVFGGGGVVGTLIVARIVDRIGAATMIAICLGNTALGLAVWAAFAHDAVTAIAAIALWGLAFSSSNSLQQARLIAISPDLASASVALNTSILYVGQAIGTSIGAALISAGRPDLLGWIGAAIVVCALCASIVVARVFRA